MLRSLTLLLLVVLLVACSSPSAGMPTDMNTTEAAQPIPASAAQEAQVLDQRSVFLATLPPSSRTAAIEAPAWNRCAQKAANPLLDSPMIEQNEQQFTLSVCFSGQAEDYAAFHVYIDDNVSEKSFHTSGMNAQWLIENDALYRYQGNGSSWDWEFFSPVLLFDAWQNQARWEILLPFAPHRMAFEVTDQKWNSLFKTLPLDVARQ